MITLFIAASWSLIVPSLYDANGWGLRVERLTRGPYIVGETYKDVRVKITLINKTGQARDHRSLAVAVKSNKLEILLKGPGGQGVGHRCEMDLPTVGDAQSRLEAGKSVSVELALSEFGFREFFEPGKFQAQLKFKSPQGDVASVPWVLDVVEPSTADILASHTVPLDDYETRRKPNTFSQAFVQQIKLGNRVFLVYRSFGRGSKNAIVPAYCVRIAELPGKVVDLKVEGAFGRGNPLTITYRETTYTKWTTTHVINSVSGSPWTAAEEKHRQEKLKLEAKSPADKK
jgi:hypothetical protein